jgi:hypothetical protein
VAVGYDVAALTKNKLTLEGALTKFDGEDIKVLLTEQAKLWEALKDSFKAQCCAV